MFAKFHDDQQISQYLDEGNKSLEQLPNRYDHVECMNFILIYVHCMLYVIYFMLYVACCVYYLISVIN